MEPAGEGLFHLGRLALAQQAVVHEDALKLRPDRLVQQQRHDGTVDAAGKSADDALLPDTLSDARRRLLDERPHAEGESDSALLEERLVQLAPARRVRDLRMELDGVQPLQRIADRAIR